MSLSVKPSIPSSTPTNALLERCKESLPAAALGRRRVALTNSSF
jgi:hypothetical protein